MMTKSKSGTWAKCKMLIALPALAALLFLLPASSVSNSSDNGNPDKTQSPPVFITSPATLPVSVSLQPQDQPKKTTKKEVFTKVEKEPQYPGGDDARLKFLLENLKYPDAAKKAGIQGKVFVNFVVEADGSLTNVKVLRGIGRECDKEAIRVVKKMPKWIPGMDKGKKVAVQYILPFNFKLDADKKEKP